MDKAKSAVSPWRVRWQFWVLALVVVFAVGAMWGPHYYGPAFSKRLTGSPGLPAHHYYDPDHLPAPFATPPVNNQPAVESRPPGAKLYTAPGFAVDEWAHGFVNPRAMALAPNGDVLVAESAAGRVSVVRDSKNSGVADTVSTFASGLNRPFGIAFYPPGPNPGYVYIGDTDAVIRFPYHRGDLVATAPPKVIVPGIPANGYHGHWTRRIIFSPDGARLYVSIGSAANVETGEDPRRAAIVSYKPDGSDAHIYASGLRNPVGLAWNPVTGALWTAVNERDLMGDDLPNDYDTSVKPGGFYGWPYYYLGRHHDPRMPERKDLEDRVITPDVLLESHCAALSIIFYQGSQFPATFRNDAFTAMHGSWNRSTRAGYKLVCIPMKPDGTPKGGYDDFVWGWALPDGSVWGRPVDVITARDGSLLVSDDGAGKIWRVHYIGK